MLLRLDLRGRHGFKQGAWLHRLGPINLNG
jgi:hypothetical protein